MFGKGISNPRLVLITGAGSGIGRATSLRFAKKGATILSTDINVESAEETVKLIEAKGGRAFSYKLDVTDNDAWQALAKQVESEHGTPDVIVNNAGMGIGGGFLEHTKEDWDFQMAVNLDGVVNGCRAFAPLMVEKKHGQIVNISSGLAFIPFALTPSYCVSKTAVRMFSECLRQELAPHKVGVTAICPGVAATKLLTSGKVVSKTGFDEDVQDRAQAVVGRFVEKIGPYFASPDYIARGIVRATKYNGGVIPVRPESWLGYWISRIAPGAVRLVSGQLTPSRANAVAGVGHKIAGDAVVDRVLNVAETVTGS
ncbi:putative oxidoreductase [Gordonia effusa NBRC 100432]|uniref:Putative oxidoreductase n=1 Tax=Gordonia effusa NBRC 100432 TaxID=1077974 RepID=H0R4W8_9ACTN|nr:SDR family NAD(P)-dependent oxidoreductase [Gordonia effusa]GAB20119.1 putative oxidoreductase [Gordonia effusa NBRC 100432]